MAYKINEDLYIGNTNKQLKDLLAHYGDTLPIGGIVNYDGSTVPEGYEEVSEMSGSNANGNWIKYADGTMICTKIVSGNTGKEFNLWANGTYFWDIQNGNWPQEFVELYNTQATNQNVQLWCNIGNVTTTSAGTTRIIRPDNGGPAGQNYNIQLLAIGRWK